MFIDKNTLVYSLLFVLFQSSFSFAEVGRREPSHDGTITAGPYYSPATKSYFELIRMNAYGGNYRWANAKKLAESRYYKNTQGRLAIVNNIATHQFISRQFKGDYFWIGLQYFCKSKTLIWIDGSDATKSGFSVWASNWARREIRCADMGYMPVHYTTSTTPGEALRWQASGPKKAYRMYLVEYPTGKE